MTLYTLIQNLKDVALCQPNIRLAEEGNVYDICNAQKANMYASFVITQGQHSEDSQMTYFNLTLFYIDRLDEDMESNRLQIQSIGKEILSNIIKTICQDYDIDCGEVRYQPFTQKFLDECAGVYATVTFEIMNEYCPELY